MYTNTSRATPTVLDSAFQTEVVDALDEVYYFLSTDGDLLQWNNSVRDVTGYTDEEIEEMNAVEFFPESQRDRIVGAVSTVVTEERKVTVEADYLTNDGRHLPYEFSGTPVYDDGSLVGIIGIGRDISERRWQERLVEAVTENVPIILFAVDSDGTFTHVRGKGLAALDLDPDEVEGKATSAVADELPGFQENIERALAGEQFNTTVDISERSFDTWYQPITQNGDVAQVVGVSVDVTDREEYVDQLRGTNERLEILNRMVRHDIRNDLAVLLPLAESVKVTLDDDDQIQRVIDAARHIRDLTETAQEYVDIITGDEEIDPEPLALEPVIQEEVELRRSMYEGAQFRIVRDVPRVDVAANELLPTVFRNLLNNAVQHNDSETPTVELEVTDVGERVRIDVADNGPGVPDEEKEHIFGKGEQSLNDPGTGIGLYLVHTLVDRYGGDVWVEDNEPRGAIFRVELPTP